MNLRPLALIPLLALPLLLVGCAEPPVEQNKETAAIKKLSPEEAQQYKSLVPGSHKSQMAAANEGK